ncbi:RNA polymerase sigma-70 factor [Longitalea luteola]|uniref:RNA polymerase sigma-70 factor n=1 Tax=Longitalea luteola TaxID=2812563 RepID=UPI001A960CDC|nr:RNA polymerase sigma-70 factor [Longitalea luteola]
MINNPKNKNRERQFNDLVTALQPGLCNFARTLVSDRETAEDIVSESFTTFWRKELEIRSIDEARALLLKITKDNCFSFLKINSLHRKLFKRFELATRHSTQWFEDRDARLFEITDLLYHAIEELPEQCGKVFKLIHFNQLNRNEVAAKLGISPNTVKNHYDKAIKHLRKVFTERELMIVLLLVSLHFLKN